MNCRISMFDLATVIITRAQPGADETDKRLRSIGLRTALSPMLELARTETPLPPLEDVSGLLFTSANGVRFFAQASDRRDISAWCVGPATFRAATEAGFVDCYNAEGDGRALADFVVARLDPADGALLHVANAAAAGDVARRLETAGFEVVFAPLYEAQPVVSLSNEVIDVLKREAAAIILVHSAKGAAAFAAAAKHLELGRHSAVAVSVKAARPLSTLGLKAVEISSEPNEDGLFRAINDVCSTL